MKKLEIHELGEVIRKVRKDRGLRLEDLADDNISPATISNIERGMPHVSKDKAYYLLKKLEIEAEQLPDLLMDEQEQLKELSAQLRMAQSRLEFGKVDEALHLANRLELEDRHPSSAEIQYIRGCCYSKRGNLKRAERTFQKGLHLAQYASQESNIEARCHLQLGLCASERNDLKHALRHIENGIRSYSAVVPQQPVWYQLHCKRAVYLKRLGRFTESMQVVREHWDSLADVDEIPIILTFYWLRSELSRRLKLWDESLHFAYEGEAIARRNHNHTSMFTFWTVIGSVYMDRQEWDKAEESFKTALLYEQQPFPAEDEPSYANTYALFSLLLMQQDKTEEAYDAIEKAIQYGENAGDTLHLIHAWMIQGYFYQSHHQLEQAILSYRQAQSLSQKYGFKQQTYRALNLLAQCWESRDETEFQNCMRELYRIQKEIQPAEKWLNDPVIPWEG